MSQSQELTIEEALSRAKKATKRGNSADAIEIYRAILQSQPKHPVAKKRLRKLQKSLPREQVIPTQMTSPPQEQVKALVDLYNSDQMIKAEKTCRELLQIYPQSLIALNVLGSALKGQGKLQEAVQFYDKAIELNPDYADAHSNRAASLQELGQLEEAVKSYDRAIQLDPDYAEAYGNRGNALQHLGLCEEAVRSYDKAIQLEPNYANTYNDRGHALQDLDLEKEAVASYDKAIQLKPDFSEAYNNRGGVFKNLGRIKEAVKSYSKAIQLKPDYAEAHRNLSTLKKYNPDDAQIELMTELFSDSKLTESERIHLCFALAKVYEDLDELDKSFNYLNKGNSLRKKELKYDIDFHKKAIAKIKDIFSIDLAAFKINSSDEISSMQPIFIVGMPRSGTSLVEQILASHTRVHGAGELKVIDRIVSQILPKYLNQEINQDNSGLSQDEIVRVRDGYLDALASLEVPERIITDKMPLNFLWVGFILLAFPEARIINLNRDPRATCWSIYKRYFSDNGNGYAYDMDDLAEFYHLYIDLMEFWRERFPNKIYDICYEDLTENQEEESRRLLEFCDLEWEEQCLDFHNTKRVVKTASAAQVRKKMYKGSSEAWKKFELQLQPMIKALGY